MEPLVNDLSYKIGQFIEYWGFKEIHGRLWTLIFLAPGPVDANYLIKNLKVSKALVSMSLKDLIHYNVIIETLPKKGTQCYEPNLDLLTVITDVLLQREAKMLLEIKNTCELLTRANPKKLAPYATAERIEQITHMVETADALFKSFLALRPTHLENLEEALNLESKKQLSTDKV